MAAPAKSDIRKTVKAAKQALDDDAKAAAAERCFANLARCPEFVNARNILAYHSLPDEISTEIFLKKWCPVKKFHLPRVNGERLDILPLDGSSLEKGAFSIMEPTGGDCRNISEMDLIIVPAVAFDRSGNRLGRGKGFYDRLLENAGCMKIGVAYQCQLLRQLPAEPHDIPMDIIVTDREILRITK